MTGKIRRGSDFFETAPGLMSGNRAYDFKGATLITRQGIIAIPRDEIVHMFIDGDPIEFTDYVPPSNGNGK